MLYINDVITFQGCSIDELKAALAESVDVYLEYCERKGRAPEKPFSGNLNVRMSPEIHQRIARLAAQDGVSINKWITGTPTKAVSQQS